MWCIFGVSVLLTLSEWSLALRLHFEEVLDLGFLVTYLLLLVEDKVRGCGGYDKNYHKN